MIEIKHKEFRKHADYEYFDFFNIDLTTCTLCGAKIQIQPPALWIKHKIKRHVASKNKRTAQLPLMHTSERETQAGISKSPSPPQCARARAPRTGGATGVKSRGYCDRRRKVTAAW